jgi:hypothetical protein
MAKDVQSDQIIFDEEEQAEGSSNAGSYDVWATFTSTFAANTLTITAHNLQTGDGPYRVETSAADLPSGLAVDTDYWIIRSDADTIQLATSKANADAGTAVALADDGTGTHKLVNKPVYICPLFVKEIKVYSGSGGGDITLHDAESGREVFNAQNLIADAYTSWPYGDGRWFKGFYVTDLQTAMRVWIILGNPGD